MENKNLSTEETNAYKDLLIDNKDVFATDLSQLSECSTLPPHEIFMKYETPIRQRCYRRNPEAKAEIRRQVEVLLKNNIIQPSVSLWSSPIVLVKKPNGTFRFCIDYRSVNKQSKLIFHHLVTLPEVVDVFDMRSQRSSLRWTCFLGTIRYRLHQNHANILHSRPLLEVIFNSIVSRLGKLMYQHISCTR